MALRLIIFSILLQNTLLAQDGLRILNRAQESCRKIKSGYYETKRLLLPFSDIDTIHESKQIYFKPAPKGATYTSIFSAYSEGELTCMADQHSFYILYADTALEFNNRLCPKDYDYNMRNYGGYPPLVTGFLAPFNSKKIKLKRNQQLEMLPEQFVSGEPCYHLHLTEKPNEEHDLALMEWHFWIRKTDYFPLRISQNFILKGNENRVNQFEQTEIVKLDLKPQNLEAKLDLPSVLQNRLLKPYLALEKKEPLAIGSKAPDWNLPMTINEPILLDDYKGELVILDFYFMSCIPCRKTIPVLNRLHDKYGMQGLGVVGINPIDTNKVALEQFFRDLGFTYPSVFHAQKTAEDYHVDGYPTLYLINRKGKIAFVARGFSEELEKELEEAIKKEL